MTPHGSNDQPCVSICCKRDKLYSPESSCYRDVSFSTAETIFSQINDSNLSIPSVSPKEFVPRYGTACPGDAICYPDSNSSDNVLIYLLDNGTIFTRESIAGGLPYKLTEEDYCSTSHVTENGTTSVMSVCESFFHTDAFVDAQSHYNTLYSDKIFYTVTTCLSLPFLLATFIVYTILPELKNLHGLIVRTYIACTGMVYVLNIIPDAFIYGVFAYIEANILFFSMLATFFWLNVMCFDIWWTFRSLQDSSKKRNRKKFILYSIYAWGCSALITVSILEGSWLNGNPVNPIYLHVILALTIICNICFFALTAIRMVQHKKDTAGHLEGGDNRRHNDEKQRFNLYLKLFTIMGLTWSVELVGFLWKKVPDNISYIMELPNMLQSLAIFIIFVWNDKVKRLLLKRLGRKDRRPSAQELNGRRVHVS